METEKCKVLLAVIRAGSFSAAAQQLEYTPSGVMRVINSLEEEIGIPLIARNAHGIAVTADGEAIMPMVRQCVYWSEQIQQTSARLRGLEVGKIAVGTYFSVAANWLPPVLQAFQKKYPSIQVHVEECANKEMYRALGERRFDCCVTTHRSFQGDWIPLQRDEMMAWLPLSHPLAGKKSFPLARFAQEPFIQPLPGHDTDVDKILAAAHISYHTVFSSVDNYTVYRMVEAGLGISMNNKLMTASWHGDVAVLPLDPPQYIELGIVLPSRRQASSAAKKFIQYVQQWVRQHP